MAYALGVRLGGDNYYDGHCIRGPVFNPSGRVAETADIARSLGWMWRIAAACAAVFLLLSILLSRRPLK
jgi:cobalamin biosynthesis protein CobD/CbiB